MDIILCESYVLVLSRVLYVAEEYIKVDGTSVNLYWMRIKLYNT